MTLRQKITRYLLGVGIGLIIVNFILDKKETGYAYLPNARVLKSILSKPILLTKTHISLKNNNLKDIKKGKINFSKSNINHSNTCNNYWIEAPKNTYIVDNCPDTAWVSKIVEH